MHMGNVFTALLAWLSARSSGGRFVLRIEDLDPQRSRRQWAELIEDDLRWLGLDWDEGGLDGKGPNGPYLQSERTAIYAEALDRLRRAGVLYPCRCTRADLHAVGAPHASDGRIVYAGTCRPAPCPPFPTEVSAGTTLRLWTPDKTVRFADKVQGTASFNLARECGDFVLRRADGAFAYQLAVVVDDALMGVSEVVRGADLIGSTPMQLYLFSLLGWNAPDFAHVPLLCNCSGVRLSKRDASLSMEALRKVYTPEELLGRLACLAGLRAEAAPAKLHELVSEFDWSAVRRESTLCADTPQATDRT